MNLTEEEWRQKLTPEQYHVLREKGTEVPFENKYFNNSEDGTYSCVACGTSLFKGDTKYKSNQLVIEGWPGFADAISNDAVELKDDFRYGMHRIEILCKTCGGHLGHLFDDSSSPSGKHYCVNSVCLNFDPK